MKWKINYGLFFGLATFLMFGCKKTNATSVFKIQNISDDIIYVNYTIYETMDVSVSEIGMDQETVIFTNERETEIGFNWFYDYGIQINSIVNSTGDTIHFNPNHVQYWDMSNSYSLRNYVLYITNSSF